MIIIFIFLIFILFFFNYENFSIYDTTILPHVSYFCPPGSYLNNDNMCNTIVTPTCYDNNCFLNNTTNIKCPPNHILSNNKCSINPIYDNGFTLINNTCVQLNGLPTCSDAHISYNNLCISDSFLPTTIYTCPDGSTNEYGGICNGNIYNFNNNYTTKETVTLLY